MTTYNEPRVSVLTPVYNGGLYLRECIESVLAQTYQNWDYTIVNNCSTDDTLSIAQEYARRDQRIRVCSNDTLLDIIANHNRAFRLISQDCKFCKILSADDWLFPDYLTQTVKVGEMNPSVGMVGCYQLSGSGNDWRAWRVRGSEIPYPGTVITGREISRMQLLGGPYVFGTPTSLLYRADLVRAHESFYPNSTPEADASACYQCLQNSDFGFVHQVLSYERIHQQTVTATARSLNAYESSRLSDLVHYGPGCLASDELNHRAVDILRAYYAFLAVSVFQFRDKVFWRYHKRRLMEAGYPFSYYWLAKALAAKIVDLVLNPKRTIEASFRRLAPREH